MSVSSNAIIVVMAGLSYAAALFIRDLVQLVVKKYVDPGDEVLTYFTITVIFIIFLAIILYVLPDKYSPYQKK